MLQISKIVGTISCVSFSLMMALTGCQSTTGKTAGQTMSDASITVAVQKKLTSDRFSNFTRIDVDTERGVVNLSGIVQTEEQRMRMGRLANEVAGVLKVNNNLQIQNRSTTGTHHNAAQADDKHTGGHERKGAPVDQKEMALRQQGVQIIQGEVVRVDGDNYYVRGQDGKEMSVHVDTSTMKTEKIKTGDRVEAKVDGDYRALSLLPAP
jgi:hyperosmotically inducible periplasmic protein